MGSVTVGSANVMKDGMVKLVSIQLLAILHGRKAMKCVRILKISSVLVQVRCLLLLLKAGCSPCIILRITVFSFVISNYVGYVSRD